MTCKGTKNDKKTQNTGRRDLFPAAFTKESRKEKRKIFSSTSTGHIGYGRLSSNHLVSGDGKKLIFSSHFYDQVKIIATNCICQASPFSKDNMYYSREKTYSKTVKGIIAKDLEDVGKKAFPRKEPLWS